MHPRLVVALGATAAQALHGTSFRLTEHRGTVLDADLDGILAEADRILDGLRPINAEAYLQQNRQRGGQ